MNDTENQNNSNKEERSVWAMGAIITGIFCIPLVLAVIGLIISPEENPEIKVDSVLRGSALIIPILFLIFTGFIWLWRKDRFWKLIAILFVISSCAFLAWFTTLY